MTISWSRSLARYGTCTLINVALPQSSYCICVEGDDFFELDILYTKLFNQRSEYTLTALVGYADEFLKPYLV